MSIVLLLLLAAVVAGVHFDSAAIFAIVWCLGCAVLITIDDNARATRLVLREILRELRKDRR